MADAFHEAANQNAGGISMFVGRGASKSPDPDCSTITAFRVRAASYHPRAPKGSRTRTNRPIRAIRCSCETAWSLGALSEYYRKTWSSDQPSLLRDSPALPLCWLLLRIQLSGALTGPPERTLRFEQMRRVLETMEALVPGVRKRSTYLGAITEDSVLFDYRPWPPTPSSKGSP